jgi:hypothetical protein
MPQAPAVIPLRPAAPVPPQNAVPRATAQEPAPPPQPVMQQPVAPAAGGDSDNGAQAFEAAKKAAALTGKAAAEKLDQLYNKMPLEKINQKLGGKFDVRSKKFKYIFFGAAALIPVIAIGITVLIVGSASPSPDKIAQKWQAAVIEQGLEKANELYAAPPETRRGMSNLKVPEKLRYEYGEAARSYLFEHRKDNDWLKKRYDDKFLAGEFNPHFKGEKFEKVKISESGSTARVYSQNHVIVLEKFDKNWKVIGFYRGKE